MRLTLKLGGSILEEPGIRHPVLQQIVELRKGRHEVILVHGGGKSLSRRLSQLGVRSEFLDGLRITDSAVLAVAVMVLTGEVNKNLVVELERFGARGIGICGADASVVRCRPLSEFPGSPEGLGFVGKPLLLERSVFELLIGAGIVPVVSSIAVGEDFRLYNVNADQMAAICGWGAGCDLLVYLTDVPGLRDANGEVLASVGRAEIERMRQAGALSGGMLPKTSSCLEALDKGVPSVYILPGASPGILLRLINGSLKEGTHIHASP